MTQAQGRLVKLDLRVVLAGNQTDAFGGWFWWNQAKGHKCPKISFNPPKLDLGGAFGRTVEPSEICTQSKGVTLNKCPKISSKPPKLDLGGGFGRTVEPNEICTQAKG